MNAGNRPQWHIKTRMMGIFYGMPKKLYQKNTFWLIATGVLTCIGFILILVAITLSIILPSTGIHMDIPYKDIEGLYIAGFVFFVVFRIALLYFINH